VAIPQLARRPFHEKILTDLVKLKEGQIFIFDKISESSVRVKRFAKKKDLTPFA